MLHLILRAALGAFGGGGQSGGQTLQVDEALLNQTIQKSLDTMDKFLKQREKDLVTIMRNEAGNVSAKAALATPPLNGSSTKSAVEAIERDVNYIFKPLENIPFAELVLASQWPAVTAYDFKFKSKRLQKAYEQGNWDVVRKAFAKGGMGDWSPYEGPDVRPIGTPNTKFHKMGRGKDGRLNGRQFHVTGSKDAAQNRIDKYAAEAANAIGQMAGGWVACYVKLNGTGFSLPLDYAKKGKGYVKTKWWGEQKEVEIRNELGNFGGFIDQRSGFFGFIVQDAGLRIRERHVENSQRLLEINKMT